jgi:hypothetical protein
MPWPAHRNQSASSARHRTPAPSAPRQRGFSQLPPSLRGSPTASRRIRAPHFQIDQTIDGGGRLQFAIDSVADTCERWRAASIPQRNKRLRRLSKQARISRRRQ